MKRAIFVVLLIVLPACGPMGLPGDLGQAGFSPGSYCYSCGYLRSHVVGGNYGVGVHLGSDACAGGSWSITATGAPYTFTLNPVEEGEPSCRGRLAFDAEEVGAMRITIVRDETGETIDTIGFGIAEPERFSIVAAPAWTGASQWTPIDPTRVAVPLGAVVRLEGAASVRREAMLVDPDLVGWRFDERGGLERVSGDGWSGDSVMLATRLGVSSVHATLRGLEASLEIEVRPTAEFSPESSFCMWSQERCDGLDNDCDGEIDEDADAACRSPGTMTACVAGACELMGCAPGYADCGGDDGLCETNLRSLTNCGGCGVVCADGEVCDAGGCALMDP